MPFSDVVPLLERAGRHESPATAKLLIALSVLTSAIALSSSCGFPGEVGGQEAPDYTIELPSRAFTPDPGVSAARLDSVRAIVVETGAQRVHLIVQLYQALDSEVREQLADRGVTLLSPIDRLTWYASVTEQGLEALPELAEVEVVRWAGPVRPEDKLVPALRAEFTTQPYNRLEDGRLIFSVAFYRDVAVEEVASLVDRLGAETPELDRGAFPVLHTTLLYLAREGLPSLASADIVLRIEPGPPPDVDENRLNAQPLSNVDVVQPAPFGLDGTGVAVGVWEAGDVVYANHADLTPRVIVEAGQIAANDDHAAHVAGTIGASGVNVANAEGMAPNVNLSSWDSVNDANEMVNAATSPGGAGNPTPIRISSHSYGSVIGWDNAGVNFTNNQNLFGQYTNQSQNYDNVVAQNGLVVVKAAGNDRNDFAPPGSPNPSDCQQGGFGVPADCIGPRGVAKNVITVGAMNGAAAIAGFSGFGPTDDGRIKPDLMAQGVNMLSLACNCFDDRNGDGIDDVPNSTTSNTTMSGTSMATPVVSGIVALLLQQAIALNVALTPAAVKAVLIQTAQDVAVGQASPGPDYATGWGIADAEAAVNLLRQNGLAQGTLNNTGLANAWTRQFYVPVGEAEVHLTLSWDDPAGTPGGLILVNDLDLRLIAPDGTVFTPWTLAPANPGQAAVRNGGNDAVNNVEQVSVQNPQQGVWTARVSAAAGNLPQAPQAFAVAGLLPHSDVVMVMDRSGSMALPSGTPGVSKIEALQSAADEFVDLLDLAGGHRLGLVQFNQNVVAFSPAFDLQALTAGNRPNAHTAIGSMSAGGLTNIIGGVNDADGQLGGATPPFPRQTIVVFSDGKHNRPAGSDLAAIGPTVQAGDYRFYSIGFGTDVDDAILSDVANASGGLHVNEQDLSAVQLTKHFLTVAALVHDMTVVADPLFQLAADDTASLALAVSRYDQAVTFAVNWIGQEVGDVELELVAPSPRCQIELEDRPGLRIRRGAAYRLVRVEFPQTCRGESLHEGTWRLRARPVRLAEGDTAAIDLMAVADTRLGLDARRWLDERTGRLLIDARLTLDGKAIGEIGQSRAQLHLTLPVQERLDSEEADTYGPRRPQAAPDQRTGREKRTRQVDLRGIAENRGGVFRAVIEQGVLRPGLVQGRVVVEFQLGEQTLTREALTNVYVPR